MRAIAAVVLTAALISPSANPANVPVRADCFPSWQIVPTPTDQEQSIWGIDGVSATDFWAVGDETATGEPTLLRWDGSTWTSISTGFRGSLLGVHVLAENDAWAVGDQDSGTLAMHWDGTTWTAVPTPSTGVLNAVASTGSSDVWAVGSRDYFDGIILHWDGQSWSLVPSPHYPGGEFFQGVFAVSPTDAWAVGRRGNFNDNPVIVHWDGTSWQPFRVPHVKGGGLLYSISGTSADDIWAVGAPGSIAFHWNGITWTREFVPYRENAQLRGVSALAPDDVWIGGLKSDTGPPIALHWNGRRWGDTSIVHENQWFNTIKAFDDNDVWAGGGGAAGIRVEAFVPCQSRSRQSIAAAKTIRESKIVGFGGCTANCSSHTGATPTKDQFSLSADR